MVSTREEEVLSRCISVDYFVFWAVKYGIVDREHGGDGQDLFGTFVTEISRKFISEIRREVEVVNTELCQFSKIKCQVHVLHQ